MDYIFTGWIFKGDRKDDMRFTEKWACQWIEKNEIYDLSMFGDMPKLTPGKVNYLFKHRKGGLKFICKGRDARGYDFTRKCPVCFTFLGNARDCKTCLAGIADRRTNARIDAQGRTLNDLVSIVQTHERTIKDLTSEVQANKEFIQGMSRLSAAYGQNRS